MARRNRKLVDGKHLPEFREWVNAATGFAALLLAAISFWTTARISGLEDYLRSEIARRNSDIDLLAERSRSVERIATERELRLSKLDAATNDIIASSLLAQAQLAQSQASLSDVRTEVDNARSELATAESASNALQGRLATQARAFELFQRQQAHQRAVAFLSRMAGRPILLDEVPSAKAMLRLVANIPDPPDAPALIPYFDIIRRYTNDSCPAFDSIQVTLPEKPIDTPLPEMPEGLPREKAMNQYRVMIERYSERREGYNEKEQNYSSASIKEQFRLVGEAEKCMCRALTTKDFSISDICRPAG